MKVRNKENEIQGWSGLNNIVIKLECQKKQTQQYHKISFVCDCGANWEFGLK